VSSKGGEGMMGAWYMFKEEEARWEGRESMIRGIEG
jgi:hypothetical protein